MHVVAFLALDGVVAFGRYPAIELVGTSPVAYRRAFRDRSARP